MDDYKENYYARYVYNAVSEFMYVIIIHIRQNGEANILNITKYMKLFKHEVKRFVESFHGITLEEKLQNMLCTSTFIFSVSEKYLTLTGKHDACAKALFEDVITSKVMDLILKDTCKIDDIWNNLKLNNVFFFIDKSSLLSMLSRSPYFDVKHSNYVSINQLKGVLGFDSLTYNTVISYFQSYLQCNKKLSYLELKRCSFLPVCELNDILKMLCIMFCSSLFKCKKSCIKLKSKSKRNSQQKKKLDLERLSMNESACSRPIGYVIYKLHGPRLTSWTGEIGNLHQSHGVIYCVIDFIDGNQGIFYVFFYKNSLQQVSEIRDLRDYLGIRDIVEFNAEFYEGPENRVWKATKIEVVKTTFKHNLKLICDNSIGDTLNNFQEKGGQNGLGLNYLFNPYENNKAKMESLNKFDLTPISYKKKVWDVQSGLCPTLKSNKLKKRSELQTPSHQNMSCENNQNSFSEKASSYSVENHELKKISTLSLLHTNGINLPNEPLNERSVKKNAQNAFLQQANESLETSRNEAIKSTTHVINVSSEPCSGFSDATCRLVMCSNESDGEKNESHKTLLPTEPICSNGTGNVKAELKYLSRENKSSTLQPITQLMYNNKVVSDQIELKCTTGKYKEITFCTLLSNSESICRSKTQNGSAEVKYVTNNSPSLEKNPISDRESLYRDKLDLTCAKGFDYENSVKIISSSKNESHSLSNIKKCSTEIPMKILQDIDKKKEFLNKTSLSVSDDEPKTFDTTACPVEINEKESSGEFKILNKMNGNCANKSFLHVSNLELSKFVYMFGSVTIITDDTGIASGMYKCNQFDVFFRFEAIYSVSNLKVKVGQKVLLYIPYGAESVNDVLAASFVYLLSSKETVQAEKYGLSAEEFVINFLHDVHISDHTCHYLRLGTNRGVLTEEKSLKLNNAFLACLHIAFQVKRRIENKKKLYNKKNIRLLKKNTACMLSDKNTLLVKHTFINLTSCENTVPNFVDCKNTASVSQLSSPKSIRDDSPSYSCASKSKSSFGSCSSFLTCDDSNEDATEEMYYSCDSVFSLDWNSPNKCSIKESVSVVPNNTDLSSHSHSAHSFLSESKETSDSENCDKLLGAEYKSSFLSDSKETSVSENCDKLLGAECKSSLLSDSSTAIESAQYEDFSNDCDITDSKYEKSEKYLKLKDVPIFKRHKKKATAKSTYKYSCNKCLNSVIVKKAFVSLITGSSLILNLKIKTHNVFLGYPVHLLPDDVKHKIKLNSVVKIMFIQENILSLSHVLALQLDTT